MTTLLKWATEYVSHRHAGKKIRIDNNKIIVEETNKFIFIIDEILNLKNAATGSTLICLNSKKNLDILVSNWKGFTLQGLKIIFANPKLNDKWIINPKVHEFISDPETLELGLKALFESVEEADE